MKINKNRLFSAIGSLGMAAMLATTSIAQPPEGASRPEGAPRDGQRRPGGGPEGGERPEGGNRPEGGDRPEGSGRPEGGPGRGPGGREGMRGDPKTMAQMMMERFDKDGDKKLNSEELIVALSEMRPPMGPGRPGGPDGPGGPGASGGSGGPGSVAWAENMFKQNDKDGDGKLTGEEIPERMRQGMARIDTNSDDSVDRAEMEQMAKNFAGGGAGGGRPPREGQPEGGDRPTRRPAAE